MLMGVSYAVSSQIHLLLTHHIHRIPPWIAFQPPKTSQEVKLQHEGKKITANHCRAVMARLLELWDALLLGNRA